MADSTPFYSVQVTEQGGYQIQRDWRCEKGTKCHCMRTEILAELTLQDVVQIAHSAVTALDWRVDYDTPENERKQREGCSGHDYR